jgi:hypothetical protein
MGVNGRKGTRIRSAPLLASPLLQPSTAQGGGTAAQILPLVPRVRMTSDRAWVAKVSAYGVRG